MASTRHRTKVRRRTGPRPIVERKAEAVAELMLEVAQCFFRIRAVGQKTGFITSWGGGAFGFMRSLALFGPLTVPQIAKMRPTSRQRMQRLADELAAGGLVEFVDNPKHRRSKLVRLTSKGEARCRELNARFLSIASTMGVALREADIRETIEIVRHLSDDVKARYGERVRGGTFAENEMTKPKRFARNYKNSQTFPVTAATSILAVEQRSPR